MWGLHIASAASHYAADRPHGEAAEADAMFTKRRLSSAGYLTLQRQCQAWGFAVGAVVALALTYFAPWMPQPTVQFTSWLISVAVVGTIGSIAGCYLADFLADDETMITPPVVSEPAD